MIHKARCNQEVELQMVCEACGAREDAVDWLHYHDIGIRSKVWEEAADWLVKSQPISKIVLSGMMLEKAREASGEGK